MTTDDPPPPPPPPPPPSPLPPPPPAVAAQWRSLRGLTTALTWLFGIDAMATVFVMGTLVNRLGTLSDLDDQGFTFTTVTRDEDAADLVVTALGLFVLASLVTAVIFIIWFFRAAKNNEALGREQPRLGAGWAIGGWFIPIANFVIPVLIAQDLWRGSDSSVPRGDGRWRIGSRSALVGWWWATLLLSRVSFFVGGGDPEDDELTVSEVRSSATGAIVAQLLTIVAAVLAILMVRRLMERQEECLRVQQAAWAGAHGAGAAPPAPPPAPGG